MGPSVGGPQPGAWSRMSLSRVFLIHPIFVNFFLLYQKGKVNNNNDNNDNEVPYDDIFNNS